MKNSLLILGKLLIESLNWPKESWVLLLQSVLVGKAQEIYGSLSVEQSSNYEHVKEAILKAYELVSEAYRQKFRNFLKYDSKTHVEFAREKENLFNRWCHSKEIGQDFKKLKQMVLFEEFKDKVRPDIRSHLDEQKVEELEKAAMMADDYALTHKMSRSEHWNGIPRTWVRVPVEMHVFHISSIVNLVTLSRKGTMVQVIEKIYPEIWMIERDKLSLLRM